jgi:hypothetical protein
MSRGVLDRHLRKLCHGGISSPFTISWKESKDDAYDGIPGKLGPIMVFPGLGHCRSPLWGEGREDLTPCGEGSLQEKVYPLPGRDWHTREGLSRWTEPWSAQQRDPARILMSPPGGAHGRCAAEALCGGLVEGIITASEAVMWTGPAGQVPSVQRTRRSKRTTRSLALQGYATAQSRVTSVTHADWPLWYPLEYKRRARPQ